MDIKNKKRLDSAIDSIKCVTEQSDSCIVMLSLGKDSLVVLDMIYPRFKRIVCVFMYFVKGLTHIQRWINWVKARYPNVEFIQIPHWTLTYCLKTGLYCVPNPKVKVLDLNDVCRGLRAKLGINHIFLGMKKADSMNRRLMLMGYEKFHYCYANQDGTIQCYPLADWTQKEVLAYMRQHNLPMPVRYSEKTASSGVGFDVNCHLWLREHFPEDLEIFYKTFPMSRRILMEYDIKKAREEAMQEEEYDDEDEDYEDDAEIDSNE